MGRARPTGGRVESDLGKSPQLPDRCSDGHRRPRAIKSRRQPVLPEGDRGAEAGAENGDADAVVEPARI